MIRCIVTVGALSYIEEECRSTCEAAQKAIERFPGATKISVRACK